MEKRFTLWGRRELVRTRIPGSTTEVASYESFVTTAARERFRMTATHESLILTVASDDLAHESSIADGRPRDPVAVGIKSSTIVCLANQL